MRKNCFLCISCLLFTLLISEVAVAQKEKSVSKKHQITVGAGLLTIPDLLTDISAIASDAVGQDVDEVKSSGAYSLSYRYFPSRQWGIGITGVFEKIDVHYTNPAAKSTFNTFAMLVNGQFNYIMKPRFDLYSRLGAGICNFNQTGGGNTNDNIFAFQVTAIGVRAGGVFNTFIEAGFGFEGLLHAGISLRL
jgi:hypothetical protein